VWFSFCLGAKRPGTASIRFVANFSKRLRVRGCVGILQFFEREQV